eukprot:7379803-Prymnesium_polylepis.1
MALMVSMPIVRSLVSHSARARALSPRPMHGIASRLSQVQRPDLASLAPPSHRLDHHPCLEMLIPSLHVRTCAVPLAAHRSS